MSEGAIPGTAHPPVAQQRRYIVTPAHRRAAKVLYFQALFPGQMNGLRLASGPDPPLNKGVATLFYFHDPMCSWCWGYRPVADRLFANLPAGVTRVNVLGGLAPDSDEPMPDDLRDMIIGHWQRIQAMLGTTFNFEFWTKCSPRRSTYPACRAVIAASSQDREESMINAIQVAYYLEARNPSDASVLIDLAREEGLDTDRFIADIASAETEARLRREVRFTRESPASGFPSLALQRDGRLNPVPVDYQDAAPTLDAIAALTG